MARIDCLDYFVDGVSLFARIPMEQIIAAFLLCLPEDCRNLCEDRTPEAKAGTERRVIMCTASRLGCGSSKWRKLALQTLLLKCDPDLQDGGRIIYGCPLCHCSFICCTIENSAGLIHWSDFRAKLSAFPDSHGLDVPDFYFKQSSYYGSLEPLLAEVA